jgi:hypothetical protein
MAHPSVLEQYANLSRTVINGTQPFMTMVELDETNPLGLDIERGSPVLLSAAAVDHCSVTQPMGGDQLLDRFLGILRDKLPANQIGDQSSCSCVKDGLMPANIFTGDDPTLLVPGAHLRPNGGVENELLYGWFEYSPRNTGIVLRTDLSAEDADTYLLVDNGEGGVVEITEGFTTGKLLLVDPPTADVDFYATAVALSAVDETTLLAAAMLKTTPTYCRNVTVQIDDAANVGAGVTAVVTGYNVAGELISETLTYVGGGVSETQETLAAFMLLTQVVFSIQANAGATAEVGFGDVFQMPRAFGSVPAMLSARADGVEEAVAPTLTADPLNIHLNTVEFDTAPDGAVDFELQFA